MPGESLQLQSLISAEGQLTLSLVPVPIPEPAADEVVVRVEASPINPSDLAVLIGGADPSTLRASGTAQRPVITANVPPRAMRAMANRVGQALTVGNEGAGTVVAAGSDVKHLLGRVVGAVGGGMYAQHRCVPASRVLPLPEGVTAVQGASWFVNPMTALSMVETMRQEGHTALVHTAAASSLGQMLLKVCLADGVPLVHIVRRAEQEALLRELGATHVCNSSEPTFMSDLTAALLDTGATLAFDAIGGGKLAGQILTCMEAAASQGAPYSPYGTTTHKQVYVYGGLDLGPIVLSRGFGMYWGVGGWLLTPRLGSFAPEVRPRMHARVAAEITTTFASHYTREVSLAEALSLEAIAGYGKQATGEKYVMVPSKA